MLLTFVSSLQPYVVARDSEKHGQYLGGHHLRIFFLLQRNYRYFLSFLFVTTALCCIVFAFCWVRLVYLTHHGSHPNLGGAIKQEPACIALIGYTFLAFW